jgi:hypothetical protein
MRTRRGFGLGPWLAAILLAAVPLWVWFDAYTHWQQARDLEENGVRLDGRIADKWVREAAPVWSSSPPTRLRPNTVEELRSCRRSCWFEIQVCYAAGGREYRLVEEVGRQSYDKFSVGQGVAVNVDRTDSDIARMVGSTHRDDKYIPAIVFALLLLPVLGVAALMVLRRKPRRGRR